MGQLDAVGFSLQIDDSFLRKIDEADAKIKALAKTSEATRDKVNAAFKSMADEGVGVFLAKLQEAENALSALGGKDVKLKLGVETSNNGSIASVVDGVNKQVEAVNNLTEANKEKTDAEKEAEAAASLASKRRLTDLEILQQNVIQTGRIVTEEMKTETDAAIAAQKAKQREVAMSEKQSIQSARVVSAQLKTDADAQIAQEKEKQIAIRRTIDEMKRIAKTYRTRPTTLGEEGLANLFSQSATATSINQRIVALQNLKNAMRDIDTTSKNYAETQKRLKDEVNRLKKELWDLGVNVENVSQQKQNLGSITDSVGKKLALLFSVNAVKNYIKKMVEVRAEFELQQKALTVILKSRGEANRLWNQVVDLAVKSPFTIQALHGYVKELSAYRIETDKLFDTTKRLADVSAGLGVDMSRLILAYGQVRAAEYLRGTELRQFTEAGIPMLQALADRFTALEGRAVSTADVFERISKRMVTFKDVAAVFKTMTDEGGTFYKMQEQQAQTLAGQISNLRDEISIMLNDIGKESQGIIMMFISVGKFMIQNWRAIAPVLKTGIGLLVSYKVALFFMGSAARKTAVDLGLVKAGTLGLTGAIKKLTFVIKSNPIGFWLSVAAMAATALFDIFGGGTNELKELDEQLQETKRTISKIKFKFDHANDINTYREQLLALSEVAKQQYGIKLSINWEAQSPAELTTEFEKAYADIQKYSNTFNRTVTLFGDDKEGRAKAAQEVTSYAETYKANVEEYMTSILDEAKNFQDNMSDAAKSTMYEIDGILKIVLTNEDQYLSQLPRLLYKIRDFRTQLWQSRGTEGTTEAYNDWARNTLQQLDKLFSADPVGKYISRVNEMWDKYKTGLDVVISQAKKIDNIQARTDFIMRYVDGLTVYESWSEFERAAIIRRISNQVDMHVNVIPQRPEGDKLQAWQDEFNRLFASNTGSPASNLAKISNAQETQSETIKKLTQSLSDYKSELKQVEKGNDKAYGGAQQRATRIGLLKTLIDATTRAIKWLGGSISETSQKAGQSKDWYSELTNALKAAHNEFKTLNKDLSASAAKTLMLERHTEVLNDIISNLKLGRKFDWKAFDLTTEEGIIQALEKLKNITPSVNKTALLNIKKALSDIRGEVQIDLAKQSLDNVKREMDALFTNYKLFVELDTMGVPQDWAKTMFGIDATNLEQVKKRLGELKNAGQFDSKEGAKQYNDFLKKISELEEEQRVNNLKKYIEYLLKTTSERVKAQIDGQKKINEINKTFRVTDKTATDELKIEAEAWATIKEKVDALSQSMAKVSDDDAAFFKNAGLTDEQIKRLSEYIALMNNAKQRALIGVGNETQAAMDKATWDEFKNTDLYIELFQNLDSVSTRTLEHMRTKLQGMRDSLKGLDPSELKEIAKKFDEVDAALVAKNPFKYIIDNAKNAINAYRSFGETSKKALDSQEDVEEQQGIVDGLQLQVTEQQKLVAAKKQDKNVSKAQLDAEQWKLSVLENLLTTEQENLKTKKETAAAAEKEKNTQKQILENTKNALQKSAADLTEGYSAFTGLTDEIQKNFGTFGEGTQDFLENIGAIVGGVTDVENGIAEILSGKAITGGLHVLTGAVKTIGGIFGLGTKDKRRERQIQKEINLVNDLQRAYEKLQKAIDEAYNIDTAQTATQKARANLQQQIQSYQSMIAAERDKKNTDQNRIKEWQQNIEDLQEQIKELEAQAFEKATDGIVSNVLDASKSFTDAWLEAFKETGNGLSGLEENFTEAMQTMLKQQASMLITSKWVEKWKKQLEKFVNADDMELTVIEAQRWADSVRESLPSLNEALKNYFDAMKRAGIDLTSDKNLSGLQAGIQGITEEQADILAAYWNSVRFYVANMDTTLSRLATHIMGNNDAENPQLAQLRIIAQQTTAINNLLSGLTAKHPTMAGYGLKVII